MSDVKTNATIDVTYDKNGKIVGATIDLREILNNWLDRKLQEKLEDLRKGAIALAENIMKESLSPYRRESKKVITQILTNDFGLTPKKRTEEKLGETKDISEMTSNEIDASPNLTDEEKAELKAEHLRRLVLE